jgi:hypothetical protein
MYSIYRLLYLKTHGNNTFSWINIVKSILDDCGYSNVWHTQNVISHKWLIESMKKYYFHEFSNTIIYRSEMIVLIAFRQLISTRMTKFST